MSRPSICSVVALLLVLASSRCEAQRLLPYVRPSHYSLLLEPTFPDGCVFKGEVAITINVSNATRKFHLHAKSLDIDIGSAELTELRNENVDIQPLQGGESNGTEYSTSGRELNITLVNGAKEKKHLVEVILEEPLVKGGSYLLRLVFNGTMNSKRTSGIFCKKYKEENTTRWLASATFEPYLARTAFPCFDEPGFKANFSLRIVHPSEYGAISNMPAISSRAVEGREGWNLTEFQTTPPMATYLVSFLVSQFDSRWGPLPGDGDRKLRVWAPPNKCHLADLALRYGAKHAAFLQEYTAIQDPLPKTDFVSIKNFLAGGLENWGIMSFEERFLLLDDNARSRKGQLLRTSALIAHEMSHVWFGNLVTPSWWDHIWLSEGFATYFGSLATHNLYPAMNYDVQSWVISRLSSMTLDSLPTTHALRVEVKDHPTGDLFDEITYHKGECIVRMLSKTLGEDVLRDGLREYLKERLYGTASEEVLWSAVENHWTSGVAENVSLAELMNGWITQPGYPLLTVERDYDNGLVTISQKSILRKDKDDEWRSERWWVPISYTHSGARNFTSIPRLWLDPSQDNVTFEDPASPDEWLLVNINGAGYYTVKYDNRNTLMIATDIASLPVEDRIQTMGDLLDLGRLGLTSIDLSLGIFVQFKSEASPLPWFSLLASLPKYLSLFRNTPFQDSFIQLAKEILTPELDKLTKDSPHWKQVMRLSCKLDVNNCTKTALDHFEQWRKDQTHLLPEELQYTVFCTAVAKGDSKTWEYLQERYKKSENKKEKKDILKALACTSDEKLLKKYMSWAMEKTKSKDANHKMRLMLKSGAERDPGLALATLNQIQTKSARAGKNMHWKKTLENIAIYINKEEQLQQLKELVRDNTQMMKASDSENSAIEIAQVNVDWLKNNGATAEAWFAKQRTIRA